MLLKSKKGAIVMGFIVSLTSLLTVILARYLSQHRSGGNVTGIELLDHLANRGSSSVLIIIAMMLIILAWRTGIAAFIIYWLNETHYGYQGAIRWSIFGVIQALLHEALLPYISKSDSFIPQELADNVLSFFLLLLVYGLVFKLIPSKPKDLEVQSAN